MKECKINILGTEWEIEIHSADEDKNLRDGDAYADWTERKIVIQNPGEMSFSIALPDVYIKNVLRHEIIHAYLYESGLSGNTFSVNSWADNEEMVDWFARMVPKMVKTFKDAECMD